VKESKKKKLPRVSMSYPYGGYKVRCGDMKDLSYINKLGDIAFKEVR